VPKLCWNVKNSRKVLVLKSSEMCCSYQKRAVSLLRAGRTAEHRAAGLETTRSCSKLREELSSSHAFQSPTFKDFLKQEYNFILI